MGSDIESYADASMFRAEPMKSIVPQVHLLSMTTDPLGAIAAACRIYEGKPTYDLTEITDPERIHYWKQVQATHLRAPLEFVDMHFFIEGVDRAFTHQLVRQRTACLSGDTVVHTMRKERRYSLKVLFEKFSAGGLDKTHVKCMKIRTCDDDGQIVYRRIGTVTQSGVKGLYEVKTHDGRSIKATSDHLFLRPDGGYSQLAEMGVGDIVVSNGKKWTPEAKAAFSEWCLENRGGRNPEKFSGVDSGHRQAQVLFGHLLELGCAWCGEEAKELAHIDCDPMNNDSENVQPMCFVCHRAMDRDTFPEKTYSARIVSIEYAGEEMTYDLGMTGEFPRFVANGLLVHNCYAQESMRFAVKDNMAAETSLPPSLKGQPQLAEAWEQALKEIQNAYNFLVANGIPAEDARGLLPHCTTTRIHFKTNLRNLVDHAGNRLCTQAQFVWRTVFAGIVSQIREHASSIPDNLWQFQTIANSMLFRPVCYQMGKCPFKADFDRGCTIRGRVDSFASRGVPSTEWGMGFMPHEDDLNDDDIPPIREEEWLLDPRAAWQ